MGVGGQRHAPVALPPEKTRHPLYRRLGGPHGRAGRERKIDPRTVQPVTCRYTDWAIPAHEYKLTLISARVNTDTLDKNWKMESFEMRRCQVWFDNVFSCHQSLMMEQQEPHQRRYTSARLHSVTFHKRQSTQLPQSELKN
jgi:hypothetical protein